MKNDKRGTSIFFALMIAVVLFVLGLALANPLKEITGEAMADTALDCANATNDQIRAVCTSIDIQQLFIGIIFGIGGLVIVKSI